MNLPQIVIMVFSLGFATLLIVAFVRIKRGSIQGASGLFTVFEELYSPAQHNVRIAIEQQAELPAAQQAPGDPPR